jgi:homoaconitase/3-isopropylmalate dehydratase large subunit
MGQTLTEKILSLKAGRKVMANEVVTVSPDFVLSHDNSAAIIQEFR